jgi:hypothetical protein
MKTLKKILLIAVILAVVLGIAAVVFVGVYFDKIVKTGIEAIAPPIPQTSVKVEGVSISALSGSAGIKGFVVGNPPGYKSDFAISIGKAAVEVVPGSVLKDKVIVRSIEVRAPEITFEGNPFGENNLQKIRDNVNAYTGGSTKADANAPAKPAAAKAGKKLQVDHFILSDAKVTARVIGLEGEPFSVTIPKIEFSGLGAGPDGITAAELTQKVLSQISEESIKAVGAYAKEIMGKTANNLIKGATENANKAVNENTEKLKKGLNGFLGK